MELSVCEVLTRITTVPDMVRAFQDESHCRRCLRRWSGPRADLPGLRLSPLHRLDGPREREASPSWALPMLERHLPFQFTVTTRTPLHATKLPLRVWLSGLWLMLQSDKGISSIRWRKRSVSASRRLGVWVMPCA